MNSPTEKDLLNAYHTFVDLMMVESSLDKLDEVATSDIMGYGTALDEIIHNRSDLKTLAKRQHQQAADLNITYRLTPVFRKMLNLEKTAVIVDELIVTLVGNEENVELHLRLSTVMDLIDGKWKAVHWHGSKPEYDSGGTDTWHRDEWKQKNDILQQLVNEKTADLEKKNHELKVEAALEKVRSVAMAMKRPDDMLHICRVISEQMVLLGIEDIRNVQTAIFNEAESTYQNYEYYRLHDTELITEVNYKIHPKHTEWANAMLSGFDSFFITRFSGDELKEWLENQKSTNQFIDSYLEKAESLNYYYYSLGPVALGMSTYSHLSHDGLAIFKRFINVFELTYKRYLDIEKAIELALQAERDLLAIKEAKARADEALRDLKSTQNQLIHAEKMASLGELTAGIAHEIQNPLNFVNNFSELSNELMEEMQEELDKGDVGEAKALSTDIRANLEKISHHGKRASGIVKGMLEHSRTRSGEKSVTDINSLADEYLRLSFHGLRAKDKSFNADFSLDLDPDLPKINLVAPDIGRVLLNLINNAFYAVHEKSKAGIDGYKPEVKVQTKRQNDQIEIHVTDNGNGIPDEIRDKIFQPFFTTKPTGEGTGLGLSLSYDIVKAHGGMIKVGSEKGTGTEFIIEIPI